MPVLVRVPSHRSEAHGRVLGSTTSYPCPEEIVGRQDPLITSPPVSIRRENNGTTPGNYRFGSLARSERPLGDRRRAHRISFLVQYTLCLLYRQGTCLFQTTFLLCFASLVKENDNSHVELNETRGHEVGDLPHSLRRRLRKREQVAKIHVYIQIFHGVGGE